MGCSVRCQGWPGLPPDPPAREDLAAAGELVSRFVPGDYGACPLCGGNDGSVAYRQAWSKHRAGQPLPRYEPCTGCADLRVLDLANSHERAAYDAAMTEARALVAKRSAGR